LSENQAAGNRAGCGAHPTELQGTHPSIILGSIHIGLSNTMRTEPVAGPQTRIALRRVEEERADTLYRLRVTTK
jgi:hypothetical protein